MRQRMKERKQKGCVVELASEIFVLMMTGSSLAGYGNPGREKGQSTDFMHLGRGK